MAVKYREEFKTMRLTRYRISIDDDQLGTAANLSFQVDGDLFSLSYQGQNDNRLQSVIPSVCTIGIIVQSTDIEDLIDDMVNSEDGRFKILIEKYSKSGLVWEKFWFGNVITDQIFYEDKSYPFVFTITAIDQLGTLKEIDYNDDGTTYDGDETIISHVLNILNKTDQSYFHTGTDIFIKTVCEWYDDNHSYSAADPGDPLFLTRTNHIAFYREDDDQNIIHFNCLDILNEIARCFGARIYQSGGAIRIEQVNARDGADFYEFEYDKTGVQQTKGLNTTDVLTVTNTESNSHLGGGKYAFLPGLKWVQLAYNHESNRNLLLNNVWQISSNFPVDVGSVESDQTTSTFKFTANLYIQCYETTNLNDEFRFDFELRLQHATRYLTRDVSEIGSSFNYDPMTWETVAGDYIVTTGWVNESSIIEVPISFETPVIPDGLGDVTFDFNDRNTYQKNVGIVVSGNMTLGYWELQNPVLEFFSEGKPDTKNTRTYQVNNDFFVGNTQTKEFSGFLGDPITNVTRGKLQVNNGTNWTDSSAWSINQTGATLSIMELMIFEFLAGQKRGTLLFNGSFEIQAFQFHTKLIYSTDNLLMMSGSFLARMETWSGSFFKINIDRNNMSFGTPINTGGNTGGLPSGGGSTSSGGSSSSSFIPPVPEFFTGVTGTTITGITGTLPPNSLANQYMELYREGMKLKHTTDFTIDENDNEIDLVVPSLGQDFELKIY